VLCERGELAEQALGGLGFVRSGLLGDVRAQRLDLTDRDLVRGSTSLHSLVGVPPGGDPKPRPPARRARYARAMGELSSAPVPPLGPADHVRGPEAAPLVVVYGDYECPFCAALELQLRDLPIRVAFRHFPVRGSHPRAFAAAAAAEAAALQGAFWPMHDALFADQGRLEDPHLWARAERLGLDLARFDADRRGPEVAARITADFRGGVRAGVPTTPTMFWDGERHAGRPGEALMDRLANLVV
jgi:protein-disulfide isomerase